MTKVQIRYDFVQILNVETMYGPYNNIIFDILL